MQKKERVKAKKRLGQHFLTDSKIASDIVNALSPNHRVIMEVGPGMGILTFFLMQLEDKEIHLVEIDEEAVDYLRSHFPSLVDRLHRADFLKIDLHTLIQEPFALIGNFPYNISSQILLKVLEYKEQIKEVVGMFQKEVALRIASKPAKKDYGILSVLLQAYYDIEYLFTVDEHVFSPTPKVKSAVVRLRRNDCKHLSCNENDFKHLVKTAFNQRRKTLRNSLKTIAFSEELLKNDIFSKRPEQLSVDDFVFLTSHILKT